MLRLLREAVEIMKAILPEEDQDEIPVGFSIVGHVGKSPLRCIFVIVHVNISFSASKFARAVSALQKSNCTGSDGQEPHS